MKALAVRTRDPSTVVYANSTRLRRDRAREAARALPGRTIESTSYRAAESRAGLVNYEPLTTGINTATWLTLEGPASGVGVRLRDLPLQPRHHKDDRAEDHVSALHDERHHDKRH